MLSYRPVPPNSPGEDNSGGCVSPSDHLAPSNSSFEDDDEGFSVLTSKKKRHGCMRSRRVVPQESDDTGSTEDGLSTMDAQYKDTLRADGVANGSHAVANGNSATANGNSAVANGNSAVANGNPAVANGNSAALRRRSTSIKRESGRLVFKNGACNVSARNVVHRKKRYLADIFTTLIDMKWRYNLLMFVVAFTGSWCIFAVGWWSMAIAHGDHLYPNSTTWEPCVTGVFDFFTAFLFSVETQHTIGYGTRVIEPHCPHGVLLLMVQSCFGIFVQSLMAGLIFAKLARPKHRAGTMMFSRHAVICVRDGEYCLLFRVGDMRSRHLVDTSIRALIVTDRRTDEGETIPLCQSRFSLETENHFEDCFVFLVWPTTFVHRIVPGSPLYALSAEKLRFADFEIIVILEGVVESTGYCIQVRSSYLPSEVLWGHRLAPLVTYEKSNGRYEIDFKQFHNVIPVTSMPDCSAKDHDDMSTERNDSPMGDYPVSFTANGRCRPTRQTSLRRLVSRWRSKVANSSVESVDGKMSFASPDGTTPNRKLGRQLSVQVSAKAGHPVTLRKCMSHQ